MNNTNISFMAQSTHGALISIGTYQRHWQSPTILVRIIYPSPPPLPIAHAATIRRSRDCRQKTAKAKGLKRRGESIEPELQKEWGPQWSLICDIYDSI